MLLVYSELGGWWVADVNHGCVKVAVLGCNSGTIGGWGLDFYCPRGFADGKNDRKRLLKSLESIFIL